MKTEVVKINPFNPRVEVISKAADCIRQGKLVALPTETVYGLAADYGNPEAVRRLYEIKQRPAQKPFTIAIADEEALERLAYDISLLAYKLADKFWPGPLTLVLRSAADNSKTIGLRMPDNGITLRVIESAQKDVVLPSANLSENKPPQSAEEVLSYFDGKIELVLDAGKTELGIESTVIDLTESPFRILREGALKKEEIENIVKSKRVLFVCTGNSCRSVMAQGLLQRALARAGRTDIEVLSAGVGALGGLGATRETLDLLYREGIDMSAHRSKQINRIMLKSSDLILVMDVIQQVRLLEIAQDVRNRLYLLKEFAKIADSDLNIFDPLGRGEDFYERTFYMIKEAVEKIATLL
jgi:tRNA threonylcarbamoyl adenosine modification protein (Sua5/YciO/YrdC/YwlC family)